MAKNLLKKALEHARTARSSKKQIELLANPPQERRCFPLSTEEIVLSQMNQFYYYFDVVRGLVKGSSPSDKKVAYKSMLGIQRAYPDNQVLTSRLEEASDYLKRGEK